MRFQPKSLAGACLFRSPCLTQPLNGLLHLPLVLEDTCSLCSTKYRPWECLSICPPQLLGCSPVRKGSGHMLSQRLAQSWWQTAGSVHGLTEHGLGVLFFLTSSH